MNRKNNFVYIPCRGKGEFCKELYKEVQIGLRFKQNPDGTVLSVIDRETVNYCPFCGRDIRS